MDRKLVVPIFILGGLWTGLLGCAHEEPKAWVNPFEDEERIIGKTYGVESFEELGIPAPPGRKLSPEEKQKLETHMKLKKLEFATTEPREREQYFDYQAFLPTEQDKIAFLSLPTMDARDRFAMQKGFYYKKNKYPPPMREAIAHSDIIVGMAKDAVLDSWGEPKDIEVAGNGTNGNERWHYTDYASSSNGFQKEERYIYFENGKVAGWQKN